MKEEIKDEWHENKWHAKQGTWRQGWHGWSGKRPYEGGEGDGNWRGTVAWKNPGHPWKKAKVEDDASTRRLGGQMQRRHRHIRSCMCVRYIHMYLSNILYVCLYIFLHTALLWSFHVMSFIQSAHI